jgi:Tol biopolymer transport system component
VLEYALQIASGLAAAHHKGIVHRDLKPENLWLTREGQIKILDFGLAKLMEPETGGTTTVSLETEPGKVMGTVAYMSPEQVRGQEVDQRSDIFSLGTVLYELLTGKRPFAGESAADIMSAILNNDPIDLPDPAMNQLVRHCLEKDPGKRFQSALDLGFHLERLKDNVASERFSHLSSVLNRRRVAAGIGAALLVGIAGLGAIYWKSRPRSAPGWNAGGHLSLIVSSAGAIYDPSLSPDGKMIAYIEEAHGKLDLYVSRVVGGARLRLTYDGGFKQRPRFSPDGERLTYTRYVGGNRRSEVWIIPVLGGDPVRLLSDARDADWSSDGKRLVFVLKRDSIATAAADGTDVRIIAPSEALFPYFRTPVWSMDGSQVVFVKSTGGNFNEIWIVRSQGGHERRLTSEPPVVYSREPVFTPDGKGIVYASSRAGSANLWILPLDGGPQIRLTSGPGPDESPSVARDGSLSFVNTRMRCDLFVEDLSTHQTRVAYSDSYYIWAPAFSPDGSEIAFTQGERNGAWHIALIPAGGGSRRQVTSGQVSGIYPRFSPDGNSMFYYLWNPGAERIWRAPRAGGPAAVVTSGPGTFDDEFADVSPDGRWLAFARTANNATRLYIAPAEGGDPRRVLDNTATTPKWSPDGSWIAFSPTKDYSGGIFIVHPDGSGLRRVTEAGGMPVWLKSGKAIVYLSSGPDGNQQILSVSLAGGQPKPVSEIKFSGTNYPFDISRDSRHLATSNCATVAGEIWLLRPDR